MSKDDRAKVDEFFQLVIPTFYQLDYKKVLKRSRSLKVPNDYEIKLMESKEAYLEAKKKEYTFLLDHPGETRLSNEDQPSGLHLPAPNVDSIKL